MTARLRATVVDFSEDRSGATAIEYALIAGAIFLAIVSSLTSVGTKLAAVFVAAGNGLK